MLVVFWRVSVAVAELVRVARSMQQHVSVCGLGGGKRWLAALCQVGVVRHVGPLETRGARHLRAVV